MASEGKGDDGGADSGAGGGKREESKASDGWAPSGLGSDADFLCFVLGFICDKSMDRLLFSQSIKDVTAAVMELPPKHPLNLYRKQAGNIRALTRTGGIFGSVLKDDSNVLKPIVPFPALEGDVAKLVTPEVHARCVATIEELQQEKKRRGVTRWEIVN